MNDRVQVARLLLAGWTFRAIAKKLNRSLGLVCGDAKAIRKEWVALAAGCMGHVTAEELAKLLNTERRAWLAFDRSRRPKIKKKTRTTPAGVVTEEIEEGQSGDPRFLEVVLRCHERRCRLLGLDAAVRAELAGPDGGPVLHEWKLTDEQAAKALEALYARLGQPGPPGILTPPAAAGPPAGGVALGDDLGGPDPGPVAGPGPYQPGTPGWDAL